MTRIKQILREIHNRFLWQISLAYLIGSVITYRVSDALAQSRQLPEWFGAFSIVLLVIGLPIVLTTAFVQRGLRHWRPGSRAEGNETADEAGVERKGIGSLFTWRNAILGGVAAFTLWAIVAAGWLLLADELVRSSTPEKLDRPAGQQQSR
ncbi:MAG: hypothetical protein JSU87_12855 [Gemmatimonadota bacterium]|nr:MAG: hypothetical protein JSU87_12855 [Gemmatimonadota bacterium]